MRYLFDKRLEMWYNIYNRKRSGNTAKFTTPLSGSTVLLQQRETEQRKSRTAPAQFHEFIKGSIPRQRTTKPTLLL